MKKIIPLAILIVCFIFSNAHAEETWVKMNTGPFQSLHIEGMFDVTWVTDAEEEGLFIAESSLQLKLNMEHSVTGTLLHVTGTGNGVAGSKFQLRKKRMDLIQCTGIGQVQGDAIKTSANVKFLSEGICNLNLNGTFKELHVAIRGNPKAILKGMAENLILDVAGAADVDITEMVSLQKNLKNRGAQVRQKE